MSYCELIALKKGGIEGIKEYRNAHGWAAYIWTSLCDTYLPKAAHWLSNTKRIWDLFHDDRVSAVDKLVLGSTFDYVVVKFEDLNKLIDVYKKFLEMHPIPNDIICHLPEMIEDLKETSKRTDEVIGVCWYGMSVSQNLWVTYTEDGDSVPYDIETGDKHWFLDFE